MPITAKSPFEGIFIAPDLATLLGMSLRPDAIVFCESNRFLYKTDALGRLVLWCPCDPALVSRLAELEARPRIIPGSGEPTADIGRVGDYYLQANPTKLYGPKVAAGPAVYGEPHAVIEAPTNVAWPSKPVTSTLRQLARTTTLWGTRFTPAPGQRVVGLTAGYIVLVSSISGDLMPSWFMRLWRRVNDSQMELLREVEVALPDDRNAPPTTVAIEPYAAQPGDVLAVTATPTEEWGNEVSGDVMIFSSHPAAHISLQDNVYVMSETSGSPYVTAEVQDPISPPVWLETM